MLRKISIRVRLTIYIVVLLTCVCVLLTGLSIYNANQSFVVPFLVSEVDGKERSAEEPPLDVEGGQAPGIVFQADDVPGQDGPGTIIITQKKKDFNMSSLWIMAAVILGGGLSTYFLLGRALEPLQRLSVEIGEMTERELSQRIEGYPAQDEIGSLAESFNRMLVRLDKAFSEQKRFSSDAAHELKTPLAVIKTNLDVLRLDDAPDVEEYEKTLGVVERQTNRMMKLVDGLFAMTSQRGYELDENVDFDRMFGDIIAELEPRIREKNLEVVFQPGGLRTMGNVVMLTRAFSNLVENAVKYHVENGRIVIRTESDGVWDTITVADNGIGIPPEKLEWIFKPFYRADESRSQTEGAGLGLAIVSEIIAGHGGSISAKSGNGETVFTVLLPVR
ncbi:MAG: HAMP domain-containing histidine kinase [Hungatella hathewayi]|nr:HAMP domain-containing histidine kinase [Hungatella hathewayi]